MRSNEIAGSEIARLAENYISCNRMTKFAKVKLLDLSVGERHHKHNDEYTLFLIIFQVRRALYSFSLRTVGDRMENVWMI